MRIALSYSRLFVGLWALLLAALCVSQRQLSQGLVNALLLLTVFPTADGAAAMLLPLLLLSERLLQSHNSLRHSPVPYLSCALLTYCLQSASSLWLVALYAATGCLSLVALTQNVAQSLGAAACVVAGLVVHARLRGVLPRSEALLVAGFAGLLACDLVINNNLDPESQTAVSLTSFPHVAGRGALVAAAAIALLTPSLCTRFDAQRTVVFLAAVAVAVVAAYAYCRLLFDEEPFLWLLAYVVSSPLRIRALAMWAVGIPLFSAGVHLFASALEKTVRRKLFHLLAVVAFLPVGILDPEFLAFAITGATVIGIIVEVGRSNSTRGSAAITNFCAAHIDSRDGGGSDSSSSASSRVVIRTHLYLIAGMAMTTVLHMRQQQLVSRPLASFLLVSLFVVPGIVGLGVMDGAAAVVGSWCAKRKRAKGSTAQGKGVRNRSFPAHSSSTQGAPKEGTLAFTFCNRFFPISENSALTHKSWEGTVAGLAGGLVAVAILAAIFRVTSVRLLIPPLASVVAGALYEATTDGIDNIELPLFMGGVFQTTVMVMNMFFR